MPKRAQWMIAGAVAVFIAVVVTLTLLYINAWSAPTKHDFEKAKVTVNTLNAQYGDLSTSLQLYSSSINDTKAEDNSKAKTSYEKAVQAIDTSFTTLDNSKAVRNDNVKVVYGALVKKQAQIRSFADGFILYRKSFARCIDVFNVTHGSTDGAKIAAAHKKAAADCLPLLDAMARSHTTYFADYAKNYASAIRKRQAVFDAYAAKKISDTEASTKITDIARTDLKSVLGSDSGLTEAHQNASAYDALTRLKKVLDQEIKQS